MEVNLHCIIPAETVFLGLRLSSEAKSFLLLFFFAHNLDLSIPPITLPELDRTISNVLACNTWEQRHY